MRNLLLIVCVLVSFQVFSQGGGTVNGSIVADLSVSSSGGVNYSVPINVPPGINGIQPDISLDFDSHSGNGLAGWGWNMSGISVITRIPSTMFHDGQIDPVDFDLDDRFALDGQRLVIKNGTYGVAGSEYQTEQYSNLKIVAYGSNPISGVSGPEHFKVFYPDGSIGHYGANSNSRSHTDYAITYWENPQGIRISYEYETLNNALRIHKIKYGSRGTAAPINEIEFMYDDRKFREIAYIKGTQFIRNQILDQIKVTGNGQQYRVYDLTHNYSSLSYQRLTKIREYTGGLSEFRDIELQYDGASYSSTGIHSVTFQDNGEVAQINLPDVEQRNASVVSLDFTGNGKMDFVVYPTIGTNAKKEFWLYTDIQSSVEYSNTIDVGKFVEMFPVSWLDYQNRLRPSQALALVQNTGTDKVDFRIMVRPDASAGDIGTDYIKTWNAPMYKPKDYYLYGNSNIYRVPLRYVSGDFDGDGISDIIALERTYSASDCIEYPSVSDPTCPNQVVRDGVGYCCYACNTSTYNTAKAHFIKLDRRVTSNFVSSVGSLGQELKATDKLLAMDVTGDGRTNIIQITDGKVSVYGLNKTNSSMVKLWETVNSSIDLDFPPMPGDYNGDGKGDVLFPLANNSDSFLMLLSTGIQFNPIDYLLQSFDFRFSELSGNTYYGYNLIPADINGDGKTDIIEYNTEVGNGNNTGNQYIRVHQNTLKALSFDKPVFVPGNPIQNSVNMETFPIPIFLSSNRPNSNLEFASVSDKWVRSFEFLRDHREDVTLNEITNNGVTTTIKYDHVNGTNPSSGPGYSVPSGTYTQTYPFVNVNVAPSFKVVKEFEQVGAGFTRKQEFYYEGAVSHANGLGFLGFEVLKQSNWYGDNVPAVWTISKYDPLLRGAITEQIVSDTHNSNPTGYMSKVNYFYDYKLIANPGSPLAPQIAENITRSSLLPGAQTDEVEVSITLQPGFHAIGSNGDYWGYIFPPEEQPGDTGYAGAVDIRLNKMETDNGLTGVFTTETYTYDRYNNPLTTTTTYPGGSRTVTNQYYNNSTATNNTYHIGRLKNTKESVTLNGNMFSTEEQYAYNNNLVTQVKKKGHGTSWLTEDFTHDANGNVLSRVLSDSGGKSRTEVFEYDDVGVNSESYGERYLTKYVDIEGLITLYGYDADTGNLKEETDPYGLVTSYEYDKWDRLIRETDYLGNITDHTYTVLTGGELQHDIDYATGAKELTLYNAFGQMTRTGALSLNSQWVYTDYEYYVDGKSKRESETHNGSPSQWNTVVYDGYGRPISQTQYTGRNISYTYTDPGLSYVVNDGTKSTTMTLDALGNTVKVEELGGGGTVDYTYYANGTLKTADYDGGNVITVGIDGWGRKTSLNDPSAGSYSYSYNDFGELLTETTPKGTSTNQYDDFGKIISRTIIGDLTDLSLTYEYDDADTKRLTKIIGADNTGSGRAYLYEYIYETGGYKRLKTIKENTGLASFEYEIFYESTFGRVWKEKYSSSLASGPSKILTTENVYDTSGLLKEIWSVPNAGTPEKLWELNTINTRGQALTITLGNGMIQNKTYDNYGYLTEIEDKESGTNPTVALHTEYNFNAQKGTLSSRENHAFTWQETFGYDNLDRLTSISGSVGHTMSYKSNGSIETNSSLGTYEYGDTSKKFRLTEIDPNTTGETYFQQHPTQQISYNAFKKPVDIHQQGHGRVSFEYGPLMNRSTAYYGGEQSDRTQRRYKKHYSAIIPAEIVEDTQAETTKIITYVGGDGYTAPMAHINISGGGTSLDEYHYLHRDYLGSILAITDSNGNVKEERQFGAWGTVDQFLDSSSGTTFTHASLLGRGYTGHEHFFEVGLIHMNGRMYDPQLGRFLSPDNYIQDPFNTQNYNRYGYVLNNPLMYTDPSGENFLGFLAKAVEGIGGLFGAIFTGVAQLFGWDGGSAYGPVTYENAAPAPSVNVGNLNLASSAGSKKPRESTGGPGIGGFKNFIKANIEGTLMGHKRFGMGLWNGITKGIPQLMRTSFLANTHIIAGDFKGGFSIYGQIGKNIVQGVISPITQIGDAIGHAMDGNFHEAFANSTEAFNGIALTLVSGGTAGAGVKGVSGLARIGKGLKFTNRAAKGVPKYLYHYTSKGAAQSISKSGLRVGRDGFSYLTNTKNLSPLQAQIELALPANRALPNSLLRINTSGLSPAAIRRVQGNLPGLGAGGGTEFLFNQTIPSSAIKIIR